MTKRSRLSTKPEAPAGDPVEAAEAASEMAPPERSPERPMSERQRRRLAEQERKAREAEDEEQRLAREAEEAAVAAAMADIRAQMSEEAPQPPATLDDNIPAPAPAALPALRAAPAGGRHAYLVAALAVVLWIGGIAAWAAFQTGAGFSGLDPIQIAIYALLALAPVGLAILLAQAVRQGALLSAETRRARALADAMVAPTALAAQQTGVMVTALRGDIDQATLAVERARTELAALRQTLGEETERLTEAAETAQRSARRLSEQLSGERSSLQSLSSELEKQAAGVVNAVERQSRMVVDASDLAQTQLREAEAALAARAADMAAAAGEAQDAARLAADDLSRQTLRLENAGSGVAEQIQSVEEGLSQQRAALVTAAYALRTDQEDFSAQVESQRAQLIETLSAARSAGGELSETSSRSVDVLRDLVEAAADQFRALSELSSREAEAFDGATRKALDRFEALAADARDTVAEESRRAMEALNAVAAESRVAAAEAADQAQARADILGEALYAAAQKADHAADSRIEGARRIVDETSSLVDEAGQKAVERLELTVEKLNAVMGQVDDAMGELDARAARMPEEARSRIDEVRATVEEGLKALSEASRKAAEDTEALDAAFQDRVKRNYDMLSEAVRLMGVVSGDSPVAAQRRRESLAEKAPETRQPSPDRPAAPESDDESSAGFGLRGRLKLEPTAPARKADNDAARGLSWKDLVDDGGQEPPLALDTPVPDDDSLGERITQAIRRMGVDPNALLPRSRVEEAAAAFQDGEPDRARQIVRRIAPAAVRSVSRRVLSDAELKADAERYVRQMARQLTQAAREDGEGYSVLSRLSTDAGRAFLLLDAAVGDLA
ncbi:tipN [Brevundimonas sp.]|uniref:tipN n=1 Tax=Brevundimonas sp. TaxID=1871086 RepID=UPI00391B4A0B